MDDTHRVSDAEREQSVALLRDALVAGRLTLEEYYERVEIAYQARIGQELARIQEDLPAITGEPVGSRRKPTHLTAALFGHVVRRGRLRLRGWTIAVGAFADLDLDLREAEFDGPQTAITILLAFGNVDVYVPEGISVDVRGITVFGHRREWGADIARVDAPVVHVRALSVFGTVDVWRVPHHMHGSYGKIFDKLQKRQRKLPA